MIGRNVIFIFFVLFGCGCSIRSVYIDDVYRTGAPPLADSAIVHSLFLIGDAGAPQEGKEEPAFRVLTDMASVDPKRSTIVFLGDNIYQRGLPESTCVDRPEMERRLLEQIRIGEQSGARTVFVPGNHDWDYQGKDGYRAVLRQQSFIDSRQLPHVFIAPRDAYPGPTVIDAEHPLRIVAIDTEWWLHRYEKPLYPGDTSEVQSKRRFLDSLSGILAQDKRTIVVAHHPLETYGEHGGFFEWTDHLFPLRKLSSWLWIPLPGIGSLYPLSRLWGISDQDFSGSGNRAMRTSLDSLLSLHDVVAYASGHEHTLQVIKNRARHFYLVSGNGIVQHSEALTTGKNSLFASRAEGFMRLDVGRNGAVRLAVISTADGDAAEVFSMMLR